MKKILFVIAALFCAATMNAQPGGMGGGFPGGGMGGPGMGGFDMMGGMSSDPMAEMRAQMAEQKTAELEGILGLTAKQSKKVYKVYNHIDSGSQSASGSFSGMGGFDMMGGMGMMGGFPGGGMGAPDMANGAGPDGMKMPTSMPVSDKEKAWREKKMSKILDYEQFRKWQEYEAKAEFPAAPDAPRP